MRSLPFLLALTVCLVSLSAFAAPETTLKLDAPPAPVFLAGVDSGGS